MRDTPRPAPTGDLDTPEEVSEMVRRFYADDNVACVHSHQLLGRAVSIDSALSP